MNWYVIWRLMVLWMCYRVIWWTLQQRFGGTCCLHLQGRRRSFFRNVGKFLLASCWLIPKDSIFCSHRRVEIQVPRNTVHPINLFPQLGNLSHTKPASAGNLESVFPLGFQLAIFHRSIDVATSEYWVSLAASEIISRKTSEHMCSLSSKMALQFFYSQWTALHILFFN
jgi:hypothetical protein